MTEDFFFFFSFKRNCRWRQMEVGNMCARERAIASKFNWWKSCRRLFQQTWIIERCREKGTACEWEREGDAHIEQQKHTHTHIHSTHSRANNHYYCYWQLARIKCTATIYISECAAAAAATILVKSFGDFCWFFPFIFSWSPSIPCFNINWQMQRTAMLNPT